MARHIHPKVTFLNGLIGVAESVRGWEGLQPFLEEWISDTERAAKEIGEAGAGLEKRLSVIVTTPNPKN